MKNSTTTTGERFLVFIVGAVQFVNIIDFMIVMPLGPDFATALHIDTSHLGVIGGSYAAAAAAAGVVGAIYLDRFDRRLALAVVLFGLVFGTLAGAFATGLSTLLAARIVAGAFGGTATSISLAIIADGVPAERRGKAIGSVMGAFSLASVLGVPAGLELARLFGFRAPFFAVGILGLVATAAVLFFLPPMRDHLQRIPASTIAAPSPVYHPLSQLTLLNTACVMLGVFAIVPNISAFLQYNLGYPRERLGLLYLVGGLLSFVAMRLAGWIVDRKGATRVVWVGTALHVLVLVTLFIHPSVWISPVAAFAIFMISGSLRMVPLQTLSSRVPDPQWRARFMSAQSVVRHLAAGTSALLASLALSADEQGRLLHMDQVALCALVIASVVPIITARLERQLQARDAHNMKLHEPATILQ